MSNSPIRGGYLKLKELTSMKILKLSEFEHKILTLLSVETLYEVTIKTASDKLLTINTNTKRVVARESDEYGPLHPPVSTPGRRIS